MTDHVRDALTRAALRCSDDDGELAEALALYDARAGVFRKALEKRLRKLERMKWMTGGNEVDAIPELRNMLAIYDQHLAQPHSDGGAGVLVTDDESVTVTLSMAPETWYFLRDDIDRYRQLLAPVEAELIADRIAGRLCDLVAITEPVDTRATPEDHPR